MLLFFATSFSQVTKPKVQPAKRVPPTLLKNGNDSASYAIGIFVVNFYKQQGITKINTVLVSKAINDIQANKTRALNDDQANNAIVSYLNRIQREKSKPNIQAGEKYLADNKKRSGVVTTASGLQYEIITQGTNAIPIRTDTVIVNYIGKFVNGTEFENSYKNGAPIKFAAGGVIPGWTEALVMMPVGSKWKLYIPYQLGYGLNDYFAIPGGSALLFEIELIGIQGK